MKTKSIKIEAKKKQKINSTKTDSTHLTKPKPQALVVTNGMKSKIFFNILFILLI